jgi:hypothetical protein
VVGNIGTLITDGSVTWQVASRVPFAVQAVPTEINGQPVPAGVYIDAAYVLNATIQNAQIADLAVDDNKIASLDVGKLTAGELNVGSFIQSTNYVAGTQGWKIHGNGFAEFGAADIRGQLTAAQIDSRGLTIRTAAGDVILNAGSSEFVGNVTGTVAGTAASTVVNTANSALSGLSTKLNSNARNILAGAGGLATGTLNWDSAGNYVSGFGIGFTAKGIAAVKSGGVATFTLDGENGNATVSGSVNVGSFTGYSWPPAGQGGAHLSQDGLLLGNFNGGGKYFQVSSGIGSGNAAIFTNIPAFINTLNIQGNAVTVSQLYNGTGFTGGIYDQYYKIIDVTVSPEGGGTIGVLTFICSSFSVDSSGDCYITVNGSTVVNQRFGISTTGGGDTRYFLPVTLPFSVAASTSLRIEAYARSSQNPNGNTGLRISVDAVKLIVMSGKR